MASGNRFRTQATWPPAIVERQMLLAEVLKYVIPFLYELWVLQQHTQTQSCFQGLSW